MVMASPGMLQSGLSRRLFERWCDDEKNGVVLAGYSVQGTLAYDLLSEPRSVECMDGRELPRKCTIEYVSFSAHVDFLQNSRFIKGCQPDNIVLVHGTEKEMKKLKSQLEKDIRAPSWPGAHKPTVTMPANLASITFQFNKTIEADLVGSLATKVEKEIIEGSDVEDVVGLDENVIIATENFTTKVFAASDLHTYTPYRRGTIYERLIIPLPAYLPAEVDNTSDMKDGLASPILTMAALILGEVFDKICTAHKGTTLLIEDLIYVTLLYDNSGSSSSSSSSSGSSSMKPVAYAIEWEGSPVADMAADCIVGVLSEALSAPSLLLSTATNLGKRQMDGFSSKVKSEQEHDEKVKAMKACLIDPSKAINHKKIKSEDAEGTAESKQEDTSVDVLEKLKYIRESLESVLIEESSEDTSVKVSLNALGDRLIVQRTLEDGSIEEAYCMIEFAKSSRGHHHHGGGQIDKVVEETGVNDEQDESEKHHAVVHSNKDTFRAMVLNAFQELL